MTTKPKPRLIAVLPGDGIGEEVTEQAVRVIEKLNASMDLGLECQHEPVGGTAYDLHGTPLPEKTLELAKAADAVLLGRRSIHSQTRSRRRSGHHDRP